MISAARRTVRLRKGVLGRPGLFLLGNVLVCNAIELIGDIVRVAYAGGVVVDALHIERAVRRHGDNGAAALRAFLRDAGVGEVVDAQIVRKAYALVFKAQAVVVVVSAEKALGGA